MKDMPSQQLGKARLKRPLVGRLAQRAMWLKEAGRTLEARNHSIPQHSSHTLESDLDVDICKLVFGNCARVVDQRRAPIVLLERHGVGADCGYPGDVAGRAGAILVIAEPGNAAGHGGIVDRDARLARCAGPRVGVAPEGTLVLVGELDVEASIDAPGDEARAFYAMWRCQGTIHVMQGQ